MLYFSIRSEIRDEKLKEKVFGQTETVPCDYFDICGCGGEYRNYRSALIVVRLVLRPHDDMAVIYSRG